MSTRADVKMNPQGRIVIPAPIRAELGFNVGDILVAHVEDGRLVVETRENLHQRIWHMFAQLSPEQSLADELIAERRVDGKRENDDMERFIKEHQS